MVSIIIKGIPGGIAYSYCIEAKDLTSEEIHYYIGEYWSSYGALLMDVIGGKERISCGSGGLDSYEVDRALNDLDSKQRLAICAYYGLMGQKTCSTLREVARVLECANGHTEVIPEWVVKNLLREGMEALSNDSRIHELVRAYTNGRYFPKSES